MRGAPQVGFSATVRKISPRNSRLTRLLRAVPMPREPRPIQLESGPMPADDGLRLDENQCPPPFRPEPPQDRPKHLVMSCNSRLRVPAFRDGEPLPKRQVFQEEVAARRARPNHQIESELQRAEHELVAVETSRASMPIAFGFFPVPMPLYPKEDTGGKPLHSPASFVTPRLSSVLGSAPLPDPKSRHPSSPTVRIPPQPAISRRIPLNADLRQYRICHRSSSVRRCSPV